MTKFFRCLSLLIASAMPMMGCATAQRVMDATPQSTARHEIRGIFPYKGERLTFDARHVATKASLADAFVQVGYESAMEDGTRYIPIVANAASKSIVRLFAKLDDRAEAYIDPDTWETIYSYKHLNENGRDREYSVWFWNGENLASVERTSKGRTVKRDYALPVGTMDSMAWVYWVRGLDLEDGKSYTWYSFDGWTINKIDLKVVGVEDVWTPLGFYKSKKYEIWRERSQPIAPRGALSGAFIDPARKVDVESYLLASAWIGIDERRTPVRLVVSTGIGDFDLLLKNAEQNVPWTGE